MIQEMPVPCDMVLIDGRPFHIAPSSSSRWDLIYTRADQPGRIWVHSEPEKKDAIEYASYEAHPLDVLLGAVRMPFRGCMVTNDMIYNDIDMFLPDPPTCYRCSGRATKGYYRDVPGPGLLWCEEHEPPFPEAEWELVVEGVGA